MDIASVYAVVLNWNLPEDTAACLRSLLAAGMPSGNIIVVDNGSVDDSVSRLLTDFEGQIYLIESGSNLGFAGGNNLGIAYALSQGAKWVFLINNDTISAPSSLVEMKTTVEQQPAHRMFAPVIYYADEPDRIWSLGDRIIGNTLLTRGILRGQLRPTKLPPFIEVDSLNACALMIHRDVLQKIGGLNTRYFMYAEDVDFCRRARVAGFRMGCSTNASVWHKVSRSTGVNDPQSRYWRTTNQIQFYRTHAGRGQNTFLILFTLVRVLRIGLTDLLQGRSEAAIATIRAWRDGWFERSFEWKQ